MEPVRETERAAIGLHDGIGLRPLLPIMLVNIILAVAVVLQLGQRNSLWIENLMDTGSLLWSWSQHYQVPSRETC